MGCVIIELVAWLALAQAQPYVAPAVVLEDQFEQLRDVRQHQGNIVVLIYGDRASANANKTLGGTLHVHFHPSAKGLPPAQARQAPVKPVEGAAAGSPAPDVLAIPVACVGRVPALVRKMIRGQVRSSSPDVPVWLDFEDVMKRQFPFKAGVPNVVVLDAHGRYRYAAAGQPTQEGVTRLLGIIEGLRKEVATPAR